MLNPSVDQSFFWKQPTGIKSIPRGNSWNKLIDGIWNTIIFAINTFEGHDCSLRVIMTILVFELYSYVHFAQAFIRSLNFYIVLTGPEHHTNWYNFTYHNNMLSSNPILINIASLVISRNIMQQTVK